MVHTGPLVALHVGNTMSSMEFSDQEIAFFDEGDTLSDAAPVGEYQDTPSSSGWVGRAMAALSRTGSTEK